METAGHALRERIIPFQRSYRTLPRSLAGSITSLVVAVICTVGMVIAADPLVHLLTNIDYTVLQKTGIEVSIGSDQYLWTNPTPLLFTMPLHPWLQLVCCIVGCLLAVTLLSTSMLQKVPAPARYWMNFNLLIIAGEAAYLLFSGHLGYSVASFSSLMLRTTITTWMLIPLIIGLITTLFPFKPLAAGSLVLLCTVYEIVLSFARYAAFLAILTHTGPLLMAAMYLLYGPLLDILPIIGIYSIFLARLADRISGQPEAWKWL